MDAVDAVNESLAPLQKSGCPPVPDNTALAKRNTSGYGKLLSGRFQAHYQAAQHAFDNLDLSSELAVIRAALMDVLERMGAPEPEDRPKVGEVISLTKEIRQLVKQVVEVEEKFGSMLSVGTVKIFLAQFKDIIEEEVKDAGVMGRISKRCSKIALPANEREAERLRRAVREGKVPSPYA